MRVPVVVVVVFLVDMQVASSVNDCAMYTIVLNVNCTMSDAMWCKWNGKPKYISIIHCTTCFFFSRSISANDLSDCVSRYWNSPTCTRTRFQFLHSSNDEVVKWKADPVVQWRWRRLHRLQQWAEEWTVYHYRCNGCKIRVIAQSCYELQFHLDFLWLAIAKMNAKEKYAGIQNSHSLPEKPTKRAQIKRTLHFPASNRTTTE